MSRLPFELLLALRYLRPKRTFVSVITSISVLGVTLCVAVLIIVISVMTGFDHQLREKILGFNTHLKIIPRDETMKDYAAVSRIVAANRNVRAVAPYVLGPAPDLLGRREHRFLEPSTPIDRSVTSIRKRAVLIREDN